MATDFSGALTLMDYGNMANQPEISNPALSMIAAGTLWDDVPTLTNPSMLNNGARTLGLVTPTWSAVNTDPGVPVITPKQFQEAFYKFDDQFQVDQYIAADKNNYVGTLDYQVNQYFEAVAYDLNDALINNTHATYASRNRAANTNCFVGIRERLDDPSSQFGMATTDCKILSTSDFSSLTATVANNFLGELENMLYAMGAPTGDGVTFYTSELMMVLLNKAVRILASGGGFSMTQDAYGRTVSKYKGARIRTAGRRAPTALAPNTQTHIITATESVSGAADTGSTYTSVYAVKWGTMSAYAWQFWPPKATGTRWFDNGVTQTMNVTGGYGLMFPSNRSIARLYGIKTS